MYNYECEYCGSKFEKINDEGCLGCGARRMKQLGYENEYPIPAHDKQRYDGPFISSGCISNCCTNVISFRANGTFEWADYG